MIIKMILNEDISTTEVFDSTVKNLSASVKSWSFKRQTKELTIDIGDEIETAEIQKFETLSGKDIRTEVSEWA